MKSQSIADGFVITLPDDWEIKNDSDVLSLFDPNNGIGALQFSPFTPPDINAIDPVKELKDYLESKYPVVSIRLADNTAVSNVIDDDLFWRYWLIKGEKSILFVSYNCLNIDRGKEDKVIDEILKSIL